MTQLFATFIMFVVYIFVQGVFINGLRELFNGGCVNDIAKGEICSGNLFYSISPKFFEKNKSRAWSKPFFSCVKCMSSFWGSVTFWIPVLCLFEFKPIEIFAWVIDIVCLVTVNWVIYKSL